MKYSKERSKDKVEAEIFEKLFSLIEKILFSKKQTILGRSIWIMCRIKRNKLNS